MNTWVRCTQSLIYLAGERAIDNPAHFLRGKRSEGVERGLRFVQECHTTVKAWFAYLETLSGSDLGLGNEKYVPRMTPLRPGVKIHQQARDRRVACLRE
jgi:hypothetical protein